MNFTLIRRCLVVVAILALAALNASATIYDCAATPGLTLAMLSTGGSSCTMGDKVFSNFYLYFGVSSTSGSAPGGFDPANVDVYGAGSGLGPYNLDFNFTNSAPADPAQVAANQGMQLQIQYLVSVNTTIAPNSFITGITGEIVGGLSSDGGDNSSLTYQKLFCGGSAFVVPDPDSPLTSLCSPSFSAPGSVGYLTDAANRAGGAANPYANDLTMGTAAMNLRSVGVQDLVALGGGNGGPNLTEARAALNDFSNTFSQTDEPPNGVPEPATLLLIGSALLGLGVLRRKRA